MNRQKIALITDSCSDLPRAAIQGKPVFVVPLTIRCSDGEYQDGVDITAQEVYERLKTELPKTSLPAGSTIEAVLDEIRAQGYERAIAVMLPTGLSGTCNMMRVMGEACEGLEVVTFDSLSGSLGIGAIVLQLLEYVEQDVPWEELLRRAETLIRGTRVFFSVDTLEYLMKGGRIGKVTAMAGSLLQIKPIISFTPEGELGSVAKVRGRKQVQSKLEELVGECLSGVRRFNLMIAHGGAPDEIGALEARVKAAFPGYEHFWASEIDATLSVYIGPGILGAGITILDEI